MSSARLPTAFSIASQLDEDSIYATRDVRVDLACSEPIRSPYGRTTLDDTKSDLGLDLDRGNYFRSGHGSLDTVDQPSKTRFIAQPSYPHVMDRQLPTSMSLHFMD